jgi:hypothetical protein
VGTGEPFVSQFLELQDSIGADMRLSWKDAADSLGFLLGLGIGVFLAFMPFLIDSHRLTIKSCCVIASVAMLAALLCFLLVKIANRREEQSLRKEEKTRDRMLLEILRNQREQMESANQIHTQRYSDLNKAEMLYGYLLGEKEEAFPGDVLDEEQVESMIQYEKGGPTSGVMHAYSRRSPEASRERIRYLADLVASKALKSSA